MQPEQAVGGKQQSRLEAAREADEDVSTTTKETVEPVEPMQVLKCHLASFFFWLWRSVPLVAVSLTVFVSGCFLPLRILSN